MLLDQPPSGINFYRSRSSRRIDVPASEVLKKYRAGKLRSGSKHGPVVKSEKQARAIQISEARAEGHKIPKRKAKRSARR
jgi:Family of unknown function (DUF6496)